MNIKTANSLTGNRMIQSMTYSNCSVKVAFNHQQSFRIYSWPEGWSTIIIINANDNLVDNDLKNDNKGNKNQMWERNFTHS